MKLTTPKLIALGALLVLAVNLHSQGIAPKSPLDKLKDIKAKNVELLEKQTATLQKLDEIDKAAQQLRFFAKRS
ncbi:MAG TPA: hypothetical protein VGM54_19325 [Chthoniobacter sp.]|jgi:hypothetical protein